MNKIFLIQKCGVEEIKCLIATVLREYNTQLKLHIVPTTTVGLYFMNEFVKKKALESDCFFVFRSGLFSGDKFPDVKEKTFEVIF